MSTSKASTKRTRAVERQRKASRKKVLIRGALGSAVVLFIVVLVFAFSEGEQAVGTTEIDGWDLPALQGDHRVTLEEFSGKPTVAAFFASWCSICLRELPGFAQLSDLIGDDVHFVGINTMNNGSGYSFAQRMGIDHWPLARDIGQGDGRQLATNFGARGSPTTVIYNETGDVVDVTLGGMTANTLAQKLDQFFGIRP